jgi:hypothetical protein
VVNKRQQQDVNLARKLDEEKGFDNREDEPSPKPFKSMGVRSNVSSNCGDVLARQ